MDVISITNFLNTENKDYAMYVLKRRAIPSIIDGLKTSQRKILEASKNIWNSNNNKFKKIYQLSGTIAASMNYHHGNVSLEDAIIQMGQDFKNPINLFETEGQWGFLRAPQAGAARYIGCRLSPIFYNIFKDFTLASEQYDDGIPIEPIYMLPIIPLVIINGSNGIAVGHASKILTRKASTIIKACLKYLKGERYTYTFKPFIKGFNGMVKQDIENSLKWHFKGVAVVLNKTTVHITEYSPDMTFEKIDAHLTNLENTGVIISYENNSKESIDIKVKFRANVLAGFSETDLKKLLRLDSSKTENLTLLDENEKIIIFKSVHDILKYFIDFRLIKYKDRKELIINDLNLKLLIANNKYRFIKDVVNNKIIINKKSKANVISQLTINEYDLINDSFSYLLSMPIHSLTKEKMLDLKVIISNTKKEIKVITRISEKEMFIADLENLIKKI